MSLDPVNIRKSIRKSSTLCECKNILEEMREEEMCAFPSPENCANYKVAMRVEKILTEAKKKVEDLYR